MDESSAIEQKSTKQRRLLIAAASFLAVLVFACAFLCWFLGIRSRQDLLAYRWMIGEHYHPIWKDLALRRIRKGDSLAETIKKHPPVIREDMGPYTALLYHKPVSFNTLQIIATNGRLIYARAGSCCWEHIFFEIPVHERAIQEASSRHLKQMGLDGSAWKIHRTIAAGQDVFLAELVEQREVSRSPKSKPERQMLDQLKKAYGEDVETMLMRPTLIPELTVRVSKVLYGDLKEGTTLTFSGEDCSKVDLAEPPTVFLHVEDRRILYPDYEAGELYLTVRGEALEWYQSLTAEQIKDLEARCLARQAALRPGN